MYVFMYVCDEPKKLQTIYIKENVFFLKYHIYPYIIHIYIYIYIIYNMYIYNMYMYMFIHTYLILSVFKEVGVEDII